MTIYGTAEELLTHIMTAAPYKVPKQNIAGLLHQFKPQIREHELRTDVKSLLTSTIIGDRLMALDQMFWTKDPGLNWAAKETIHFAAKENVKRALAIAQKWGYADEEQALYEELIRVA